MAERGSPRAEGGKTPRRKVLATTGGAAWGLWLGQVLVYAFEEISRHDLPVRIEDAGVGLIGLGLGAAVGYLVPAEPGE